MKIVNKFFLIVLGLVLFSSHAFAYTKPLSVGKVFQFSAEIKSQNEIVAQWKIEPNHYLYVDRLKIAVSPGNADIQKPRGEFLERVDHGRYEVYSNSVSVPIILKETAAPEVKLSVDYQGCSLDGFCYPPMHKEVTINLQSQTIVGADVPANKVSFSKLLTDQNSVKALFDSQRLVVMLLLFLLLGLFLAFTPCVLPMIPILTGIIVGQKQAVTTKKAFILSLTYVLGVSITYALAGLGAAAMGSSIQVWLQKPIVIYLASALFILLALSSFGLYELRISNRWQNKVSAWSNKHQGGTFVGVFFMGIISTLIVSPCVTAPLIGVLIYIGDTGNMLLGASALFAIGFGMGIPLLFIGASAGKWLPKSGPWMEAIKNSFGILMLAVAVWLLSRVVSQTMEAILWGLLVIGIAVFLGKHLPRLIGFPRFHRGLGLCVGLAGIFLMLSGLGALNIADRWFGISEMPAANTQAFTVVNNMFELDKQLAAAKAEGKPVLVDFYADWCESCVVMEKNVFSNSQTQQVLSKFKLIRVDLTANNADDEVIMKNYDVIAPPTVLFFNTKGNEINAHRIIGEVNLKEFLSRLKTSCDTTIKC